MPSLKDYLEQVSTLYSKLPDDKKQEIAEKISSDPNLVHELLAQTSKVYNKLPLEKKQKIVAEFSSVPWYKKAWRAFAAGSGEILNDVGALLNKIGDVVEKGGVSPLPIYGVSGKEYKSAAKQAKQIAKDTKQYWLPENKPTSEAYKIPVATPVIESIPEMLMFAPTMEAGGAIGAAAKLPKIAQYVTSGLGYSLPKLGLGTYSKADVATQAVLDTALGAAGTLAGKVIGRLFGRVPIAAKVKRKIAQELAEEIKRNPPKNADDVIQLAQGVAKSKGVDIQEEVEPAVKKAIEKDLAIAQGVVSGVKAKEPEIRFQQKVKELIEGAKKRRGQLSPEEVAEQLKAVVKEPETQPELQFPSAPERVIPPEVVPEELPEVRDFALKRGAEGVIEYLEAIKPKENQPEIPIIDVKPKVRRQRRKIILPKGYRHVSQRKIEKLQKTKEEAKNFLTELEEKIKKIEGEQQWQKFVRDITQNTMEKEPPKNLGDTINDISEIRPEPTPVEKLKEQIEAVLKEQAPEIDEQKLKQLWQEIAYSNHDLKPVIKDREIIGYRRTSTVHPIVSAYAKAKKIKVDEAREKLLKAIEERNEDFKKWILPEVTKAKNTVKDEEIADLLTDENGELMFGGLPPSEVLKSVNSLRKKLHETLTPINPKLAEKFYSPELKNEPKDINFIQQYLFNPEMLARYRGDKYPQVKRIYNAFVEQDHKNNKWLYQVNRLIDRVDALSTEDKDKLFKALYRESHTGKQVDPNILPEHLRPIYKAIRFKLKQIWSDYRNTFRKDLEEHIRGLRVSKEKKAALLKALNTGKVDEIKDEFPALAKKIEELHSLYGVPFYMPQKRTGKWLVSVRSSTTKLAQQFEKLSNNDKERLIKALKEGKPDVLDDKLKPLYSDIYKKLSTLWKERNARIRQEIEKEIAKVPPEKRAILKKALDGGDVSTIKKEFPKLARRIANLKKAESKPVFIPDKQTDKWLINKLKQLGSFKFVADFDTKTEALQFYQKAKENPLEAVKKWHDELGIPMPTKADTELEVLEPVPATQPLHEWREDIPLEKTRALLVNLAKNKGNKAEAYEVLLEDLTNWFKSMGWSAHTIKRKNIPGFQLDPDVAFKRLKAYLIGYGLAKNKKEAAKEALDAFYDLATSKGAPERLTTWLRDYIDYVLGTPEKAGAKIGRAVSTYYLWAKPLTVMVNSLQNILTGVPEYIYRGIDPRGLATAYAKIFGKKKLKWDEKKAIVRALEEGEINPKVLDEMLSNWGAKSSKILNAIRKGQYGELLKNKDALKEIVDIGMLPFTLVESYWNRLPFFLGAFSHYRAKGLSFDEAYKKAVEALHGAHYYAGRPNRWKFQRGDAGRILTALQTFTYHYLDQLTKYMGYSVKGDKQAQKALAAMLVSMLALGGISGVGGDALYEYVIKPAYKRLTGQDLDWVLTHSEYGDIIKYGLLAPLSPSIGRSIGVGLDADPERAIGGPVQGILRQIQRAKKLYDMGDTTGAIIQLLPPGLRNPVKAYLASKRGITSYRGTPLRDPSTGKFVKPETPYEKVLYAMGIMPRRIERIYDKIGAIKQAQEEKNKALQKITHLYVIGRKEDAKKVYLNWNKHCYEIYKKAKTPEQKAYWRALIISPVSVRRAIRGSMRGLVGISKGFLGI